MDLERVEYLAKSHMLKYGLTQAGWEFGFNNRKRSYGVCKYGPGGTPGIIEINGPWAETAEEADVIDTIKHECAHALVGPRHGHDDVWKAMCRRIGCKPQACGDEEMSGEIDNSGAKFFACCGSCEQKFYKFRRPKRLTGAYCTKCGPELGAIQWKPVTPSGTVIQQPRSLAEMGVEKHEIKELVKFANGHGCLWKEKIIALWAGERGALLEFYADTKIILGLEEKIRMYLNIINFKPVVLD